MSNKVILTNYLQEHFPERAPELIEKFERYYDWVLEINNHINLISRKTDPDTIWTTHILDSILIHPHIDFSNKTVLDFGTGGGFPGIPLAILYPTATVHLLDGRRKKVDALSDACEEIGIDNCRFIHARLEDMGFYYAESFEAIVCRSVRIVPELKIPLLKLLTQNGKLYLYKSIQLDDVAQFKKHVIYDVSRDEIGTRKIVEISK